MTIGSLLICIGVLAYVAWLFNTKKVIREIISNLKENKKYSELADYINQKVVKFILTENQYDINELLTLYELDKKDEFNSKLNLCFQKNYKEEGKLELLMFFYHYFLVEENQEYALKLKDLLSEIENEERMIYHDQLFQLTFTKNVDFINDMEVKVEKEIYVKNDLAVICYFLAIQHLSLNNDGIAKIYRDSAERYIYVDSPFLKNIVLLKKDIELAELND